MSMDIFLQHLLNGISVGSLYAMIAIGYTMVYGILLLINFAHGDIFMMASYFMIFAVVDFGLPVWISLPMIIVLTVILGMLLERSAYKPLRNAPRMSIMISAIGVSYLLENLAVYLFSGVPKGYPDIPWLTKVVKVGNISFQTVTVIAPVLVVLILAGLMALVNHTKTGMAMRAVSKDFETARLMGVKIDRVIAATFAIGSGLAAIGSVLWGAKYSSVYPLMGVMPGLKCFVAAVFGGIGNIPGAVLGGIVLGLGETLLVAFFPGLTGYRDAFAFVVLIVMLLVRPNGLLGEKEADKV